MNLAQARYRTIASRAMQQVRVDRNPNHQSRQQSRQRWSIAYSGVIALTATSQGREGGSGRYLLQTPDGSQFPAQAIGQGGIRDGATLAATVLDGTGGWGVY